MSMNNILIILIGVFHKGNILKEVMAFIEMDLKHKNKKVQ